MSYGFKTGQLENVTAEVLESSGLAGWKHEIKPKAGETFKFVPLHGAQECLEVMVHQVKVKFGGSNAYVYIPSGSRNKHLFTPVVSPFESDPRDEVNKIKPARFMLVYVLQGGELKDHVAFIELRSSAKKNGSYDDLLNWETQSGDSVENQECTLTRTGSKLKDTVYQAAVLKEHKWTKVEETNRDKEANDVYTYLADIYTKVWTLEDFQNAYQTGIMNNVRLAESQPELVTESDTSSAEETADFPF